MPFAGNCGFGLQFVIRLFALPCRFYIAPIPSLTSRFKLLGLSTQKTSFESVLFRYSLSSCAGETNVVR